MSESEYPEELTFEDLLAGWPTDKELREEREEQRRRSSLLGSELGDLHFALSPYPQPVSELAELLRVPRSEVKRRLRVLHENHLASYLVVAPGWGGWVTGQLDPEDAVGILESEVDDE